ncbi:MAG: conserved oligomeric Golgi complex subunit 6 [Nitrosarchaeum sp.]|nr:conserved oligomeric Golgi complex subunit 6 [Nitrosarchaeum sp.]
MAESKVTGIIQSLNGLEDDLDSLNSKVADMKKQLTVKAQNEIDKLLEKTKAMAIKEAETIINASKDKANLESTKIIKEGEAKLAEIQSKIDANFDEAVRHVVSTVLKA